MSLVHMGGGAVTDTGCRVVAKVTGASTRLAVADNANITGPTFFGPVVPTADGIAAFTVTGLAADSPWWYAIEDDSVLNTATTGQFRTHRPVGTPFSYRFAAFGDAGLNPAVPGVGTVLASTRLSNHTGFDEPRLASPVPLFQHHLGDMHYYDLGSGNHGIVGGSSLANYRRAYDDVFAQPRQYQLYRTIPTVYTWDDHDFGPNDSDRTHAGRDNAGTAYRERVPHYPLQENGALGTAAIYHSFPVGRVLHIVTDSRYHRDPTSDPAPRSYLGAAQKTWLNNLLATSTAALAVAHFPQPISSDGSGSWGSYPEERAEIYAMFADNGWLGKAFVISGDQHQFGWDDGANTGGLPLYTLASMDCSTGSLATSKYNLGAQAGRGQYGIIHILDFGKTIRVRTKGMVTVV